MGTILTRKLKGGRTSYIAQVRIAKGGKSHSESKTFEREAAARTWMKKREAELAKPGALGRPRDGRGATLADAIDRYIGESRHQIGKTKAQVLSALKQDEIAGMACAEIGSADIIALTHRLSEGRQPQTVQNYLSHLGAVFKVARPAWRMDLDPQALSDARMVGQRLGLTAKSGKRDRRPTLAELDRLMSFFAGRAQRRPDSVPMHVLIAFAIFSTRRQDEICRIVREDLDARHSRIWVRDMKHPGEKIGNDVLVDLPEPALAIITAQGAKAGRLFPYSSENVSTQFTRACKILDIDNLHFHDLRHEGISRLFEMGFSIPRAATVSGHRTWSSLQRYSHLRQAGDKFEHWPWLGKITGEGWALGYKAAK
jgi:integrase